MADPKEKPTVDENPNSDALDASPEFDDSMEEMTEDFFAEEDPEFADLLKRVKEKDANEETTASN